MILWFLHRFPVRQKLLDEFREKTVKKYSKRIGMFIEEILVPFARLKAKDETLSKLAKVSSVAEHKALMKSIDNEIKELQDGKSAPKTPEEEEATKYVIEVFLDQLTSDIKADHNKAFHQPLKEKHAKIKLKIDRLAFRFRRHVFISATVFAVFSIFIEILSK